MQLLTARYTLAAKDEVRADWDRPGVDTLQLLPLV